MSKRILLTGVNGFVGSWILDHLLRQGHFVQAIVRSESKAERVSSDFLAYKPHFKFGIVPNITAPGAYDEVVQSDPSFDVVIHTASSFLYKVITDKREFLDPAIRGTLGVLESVKNNAPEVKRVVVTSRCAAIINFAEKVVCQLQKVSTEEDWNPATSESALEGTPNNALRSWLGRIFVPCTLRRYTSTNDVFVAWDFVEKEKPNFDLVTLTLPMVYGSLRHTIRSTHYLNESNLRIYSGLINLSKDTELPPNGLHVFTDVRDLAGAHVLAATLPEASGQRFIVCEGQISSQNISDIIRKKILELEERTIKDDGSFACSSERAEKVLGLKFRSKEETFVDLARQLLEMEKKEKDAE
ncbi:uncharacterized protein EAF01_004715 [Botrytis porri]|uniref:uncharacterized protein n=1 Tax=Botrytis porri TaxID=87229 RepID=UPI00190170AB|nr:uncharacterized protein EAF01_004715 [Botrytis porri]KAF7907128.1 hypothetical protein EAF01_004715 [Botrytis porri]